ncbi:ABC transporter substrate-binding protein [Halobellus rufus]|uniref:ABC transporter substrate-binding protein n=1 Tax=Halobellus rufus TaxID=1448860 RepID=UPI0006785153|nr:ABC transporter substrate-binding protein [Halobellus rufus]
MSKQRSRRRFLQTLVATAGAATIAGCSGTDEPSGTPTSGSTSTDATTAAGTTAESASTRTIEDLAGRTVEVPASVESVIGVGSGALRLITYLDAEDHVIAVEDLETTNEKRPFRPYVHANPSLSELPSIGRRNKPDAELLLQQDPDVIIWAWGDGADADNLQSQTDIPVVVVQPGDINAEHRHLFFESLDVIGEITDRTERAEEVQALTDETIADLDERTSDVGGDRPSTYVGYLGRGNHGLTRTQPLYTPLEFVNADNVASDLTGTLTETKGAARIDIDPEEIIDQDPSYLFVDMGTVEYEALSEPQYESVTAIENGDVYTLFPVREYSINFGTALANAYYAGSVLYPDRFNDVDPAAKADEIWESFVGAPVYEDLAETYRRGFGSLDV